MFCGANLFAEVQGGNVSNIVAALREFRVQGKWKHLRKSTSCSANVARLGSKTRGTDQPSTKEGRHLASQARTQEGNGEGQCEGIMRGSG